MNAESSRALLELGINPRLLKVESHLIDDLMGGFGSWTALPADSADESHSPESIAAQRLVLFLLHTITEDLKKIQSLRQRYVLFSRRYVECSTDDDRRQHILDYARELGSSEENDAADRKSFSDWFGFDAAGERYRKKLAASEQKVAFCLQRLGVISAFTLEQIESGDEARKTWRRIELEKILKPLLAYDGDKRVGVEAFRCLATAIKALPENARQGVIAESTILYVQRSAFETRQDIWIQCEALGLLGYIARDSLLIALKKRLSEPKSGDDMFVRRHAVKLLGQHIGQFTELAEVIPSVVADPSPFVRQALAKALSKAPNDVVQRWLPELAHQDDAPEVRASALLETLVLLQRQELNQLVMSLLLETLEFEQNSFVLRVALKVVVDAVVNIIKAGAGEKEIEIWQQAVFPSLDKLHRDAESLSVRRWAAQAAEQVWAEVDTQARELKEILGEELQSVKTGKALRMSKSRFADVDDALFHRVLSVIAQDDLGYDIKDSRFHRSIRRGHVFGWRLWRFLHEFRNPSSDKRQGFIHTVGRIFSGRNRVPSSIMSEVTEAKVPGEPLLMSAESGWRPYLPLVDEVLSSLEHNFSGKPTNIYSSEGVTKLQPPRSIIRQLTAMARLEFRFSHFAGLRNWKEDDQLDADAYLKSLEDLGFKVSFTPHQYPGRPEFEADPSVTRFFPAFLPFGDSDLWFRIQDYFFSVYENSMQELVVFASAFLLFFVGRHIYMNRAIGKVRQQLPLVIGGWGTRGKSGTERLKAAVFNALGYGIVSKTTGCEALFLNSYPYGKLHEFGLYRSYDKATIWEQYNLVQMAGQCKADVFLWECMGLTPSYVKILQRQWMKDDVVTITNAFPDHEDLQGPAGFNIPEVMTNFIPRSSTLLCSEEQMLPVLRDASRQLDTNFKHVGWLEAGLLTEDILQRFPYEEHPYNIALTLLLAEELGIEHDFALREMADRVIPDIGVLKKYPEAKLQTRKLVFVNGMSANERYGCLQNWERMGFAQHDPEKDPETWLSTVVNNRADRVARSRAFAKILVEDLSVDSHFLIGSNLSGLQGYIKKAWDESCQGKTLWPESGDDTHQSLGIAHQAAKVLRVPTDESRLKARLRVMLKGPGKDLDLDALLALWQEPEALHEALLKAGVKESADAIVAFHQRSLGQYQEYQSFLGKLEQAVSSSNHTSLDVEFHALQWKWFQSKLVVIEDANATGEQVIARICEGTPPGCINLMMGLQNIKGTGLDFMYRWQAWDTCYSACENLRSDDPRIANEGLLRLSSFQEFGLLSEQYVQESIEHVRHSMMGQSERFQAELNVIESNLGNAMQEVHAQLRKSSDRGRLALLVDAIEEFFDTGDAVRRRKTANKIYKELAATRISHERASIELHKLNQRQKGGWLLSSLYALKSYIIRGSSRA